MFCTEVIKQLSDVNFSIVIMGIFIIMSVVVAVHDVIGKFSKIIGKPLKWVKKNDEVQEMILEHEKRINSLAEQHENDEIKYQERNNEIEDKLSKLTDMVLNKEISDLRWTILDFSSALSNGRKYNGEAFKHIFSVYTKYEKILEENNMENGLVEESMRFIRDKYQELLRNGGL